MKFSFERAKENSKKIIMGAGLITASVGSLEAQEFKPNINEINNIEVVNEKQDLNNIDKNDSIQQRKVADQKRIDELEKELGVSKKDTNDKEFYRNEYLKYMEHPSYKQRLAKEMYGDENIDEEKQKKINSEYTKRLNSVQDVPINLGDLTKYKGSDFSGGIYTNGYKDIPRGVYIDSLKSEVLNHELSHAAENMNEEGLDKGFNEKKEKVFPLNGIFEYYVEHTTKSLMGDEKGDIKINKEKNININFITKIKKFKQEHLEEYNKYSNDHSKIFDVIEKYYYKNSKDSEPNHVKIKEFMDLAKSNVDFISANDFTTILNLENDFSLFAEFKKNNIDLKVESDYWNNFSEEERGQAKKTLIDIFDIVSNSEIKARLNTLRIRAIENNDYNLKEDFDINKYNNIKESPQYKSLRRVMSDDQINELIKYTVMNDENIGGDKTYVHPGWNYGDQNDKA